MTTDEFRAHLRAATKDEVLNALEHELESIRLPTAREPNWPARLATVW